jgi:hypothetical protein
MIGATDLLHPSTAPASITPLYNLVNLNGKKILFWMLCLDIC